MIASTIQLISNSPKEEQSFISGKMLEAVTNMNQLENRQPLVQVAVWTLGEYGETGHFDGKQERKLAKLAKSNHIKFFFSFSAVQRVS